MCCHPDTGLEKGENQFIAMAGMVDGTFQEAADNLEIRGNETGIKGGWFTWPVNFDPIWLLSCNGFKDAKHK